MAVFRRVVAALAVGYLFMFYGEVVFWMHRIQPADMLLTWLVGYSVPAYLFLWIAAHFRARSFWAVFLSAAVYGWLVEGVVVQTMYDQFPLNISWTGLAWHALLAVVVGWWWMKRLLGGERFWPVASVAGAVGVFWAMWSIFWWVEDGTAMSPHRFGMSAFLNTALAMLAYLLAWRAGGRVFQPSWGERIVVTLIVLAWFCLATVPAQPRALLILPPLLGVTFLVLQLNRRHETRKTKGPDEQEATGRRVQLVNLAGLLLMPGTAWIVYSAAYLAKVRWQTNIPIFLIATPLGFVLYCVSTVMIVRDALSRLTKLRSGR